MRKKSDCVELYSKGYLTESAIPYLSGSKFSDGCTFEVEAKAKDNRDNIISKIVRNKRVIHLGACDHEDLIEYKRKNGKWMHDKICDVAAKVLGIDINESAVKYCMACGGVTNIICANILTDRELIVNELNSREISRVDYLFAGEILEHIDNPVEFLTIIKDTYSDIVDRIIITVPNAYSYVNIKNSVVGFEKINTDHKYWFSPYTISKVMFDAGIIPESLYFADSSFKRKKIFVEKLFSKNMMYKSIVCVGKL